MWSLSFDRLVVDLRFLVGCFKFHYDWAKSVVTTHNGDAGFLDRVAVVEERLVRDVRERILLTHGHTPDSVTYHLPSENCAFVGDTIIDGNVGLTKFPGGDQPTLILSLETRILTLPADYNASFRSLSSIDPQRISDVILIQNRR